MERLGRRLPLIYGGLWQSLWLFVFAAAGTASDPADNKGTGKLMITSACLFIMGYAMTWAPGVWILIGDTFPTRTRAKQGALSTASNWTWNFLLAFFTPFIAKAIKFRFGFMQPHRRAHRLFLPLRNLQPQPRERRQHVQRP